MDYAQFQNPKPPKPKPTGGNGKTMTGKLRCVSYLWETTVPGNRFGTDGPQPAVPQKWSETLLSYRQWHGIDLTAKFLNDGTVDPASIQLVTSAYSGKTKCCGFIGKTTTTDRHVTEPTIGEDPHGVYVEVKSLLGTRLGAFVPDIAIRTTATNELDVVWHGIISTIAELTSEDQYLGTNTWVPKIFTYVQLRLYEDGARGGYVSPIRANGFVKQKEIIEKHNGSSWIPEHHIYLNGKLNSSLSQVPTSPGHQDEIEEWVKSGPPGGVYALQAMTEAFERWERDTPLAKKKATAKDFEMRYPDYFVGTDFKP